MKYEWILFDADDTLLDFKSSARHALGVTMKHFDLPASPHVFSVYEEVNHQAWKSFEMGEITALELRKVRFERFLDAIGEFRDPLEMNGHYLKELSNTRFLVNGARELLEELHAGKYRLCLITNGLKEVQRPRIARAKLEHYFEAVVVSDEIGVAKPQTGFFDHVFSQIGQPDRSAAIVVGDSLSSDIQGGNNYGIDTCWYNPENSANLTGYQPTFEIDRLEKLWSHIAG